MQSQRNEERQRRSRFTPQSQQRHRSIFIILGGWNKTFPFSNASAFHFHMRIWKVLCFKLLICLNLCVSAPPKNKQQEKQQQQKCAFGLDAVFTHYEQAVTGLVCWHEDLLFLPTSAAEGWGYTNRNQEVDITHITARLPKLPRQQYRHRGSGIFLLSQRLATCESFHLLYTQTVRQSAFQLKKKWIGVKHSIYLCLDLWNTLTLTNIVVVPSVGNLMLKLTWNARYTCRPPLLLTSSPLVFFGVDLSQGIGGLRFVLFTLWSVQPLPAALRVLLEMRDGWKEEGGQRGGQTRRAQ